MAPLFHEGYFQNQLYSKDDANLKIGIWFSTFLAVSILTVCWFSLARSGKETGKKIGVTTSNLADEFSSPQDHRDDYVVKSIWIYPIKSCKGIELSQANVVKTGYVEYQYINKSFCALKILQITDK